MKTGNEAYEDKERYGILEKIGVQRTVLKQSVKEKKFVLLIIAPLFLPASRLIFP